MDNIIQQFLEKVMCLEEKSLENLNNLHFLADFTENLNEELMKLGKEIVLDMLEYVEQSKLNH